MKDIRAFLIGILNIVLVAMLVVGTLGGFVGGGFSPFGGFRFGMALLGAIFGFIGSAVAAGFLALMIDIREILLRIEQRGLR
ncbi:MAG: hypothetical protein BGP12_14345 [Rhodospirillales bacterium 70-18]|nr:hypothetical protein [Rhodospirillales bacterium]OJY67315.1 MAG: hypothetical protein BGP12_14345 [Rhodospirillales bacterium 70-18]